MTTTASSFARRLMAPCAFQCVMGVVDRNGEKPELVVLKGALQGASRKNPASAFRALGGTV